MVVADQITQQASVGEPEARSADQRNSSPSPVLAGFIVGVVMSLTEDGSTCVETSGTINNVQTLMELWEWRRRVSDIYAKVRALPPEEGWHYWRDHRDALFRDHPQSPIPPESSFSGLGYHQYDEAWRFELPVDHVSGRQEISHSDDSFSQS